MIVRSGAGSERSTTPLVLFVLFSLVFLLDSKSLCAQFQGVVINAETDQPLAKVQLVLSAVSPSISEYRVFVHYRWTSNVELSAKWRYASGMPLPLYAQKRAGDYYVAARRNQEFMPDYARFDARLAKSFPKDRYRITLFVEVLNLLDRENVRYAGHEFGSVNPETGRIKNLTSQQFPILPTAGIMFEF